MFQRVFSLFDNSNVVVGRDISVTSDKNLLRGNIVRIDRSDEDYTVRVHVAQFAYPEGEDKAPIWVPESDANNWVEFNAGGILIGTLDKAVSLLSVDGRSAHIHAAEDKIKIKDIN